MPKNNDKNTIARKRMYWIWSTMIQRCTNTNNKWYKNYGGRGVFVCARWRIFENFLEDMGYRPEGMSLERINNNDGYHKDNCIWADRVAQARNRRSVITHNGETCKDASVRLGSLINVVSKRIRRGWAIKDAFETPMLTNGTKMEFSKKYPVGRISQNKITKNRSYNMINADPLTGERRRMYPYARYLIEKKLGRYLDKEEYVIHLDKDPLNDTLENLRIVSKQDMARINGPKKLKII